MFCELILDIFNTRPWPYGQWALPTVSVVNVLDEYLQVDGRVDLIVGEAVVVTHDGDVLV